MFTDLRPYRKHRETNGPWMPEAPAHWGARRIKTVLRERVEPEVELAEPVSGSADDPVDDELFGDLEEM